MTDKFNSLDTHKYVSIVYFSFCALSYDDPSLTGIFFFFFLAVPGHSCSMQNLVPYLGIKSGLLELEEQSLNHWTTREVPLLFLCMSGNFLLNAKSCDWNIVEVQCYLPPQWIYFIFCQEVSRWLSYSLTV